MAAEADQYTDGLSCRREKYEFDLTAHTREISGLVQELRESSGAVRLNPLPGANGRFQFDIRSDATAAVATVGKQHYGDCNPAFLCQIPLNVNDTPPPRVYHADHVAPRVALNSRSATGHADPKVERRRARSVCRFLCRRMDRNSFEYRESLR